MIKYENRVFFQEPIFDFIFFNDDIAKDIMDVSFLIDQDKYVFNERSNDLIKIRENELQIKPFALQTDFYQGYEKKIKIEKQSEINSYLNNLGEHINFLIINKKRYKFNLHQSTKLELSKLFIGNYKFFSFCLESKNIDGLHFYYNLFRHNLVNLIQKNGNCVLGYNQFLKWLKQNGIQ